MSSAPSYDLLQDFGNDSEILSTSPHWALAVVRLGLPLSYSRKKGASVTSDVSEGAKLRAPTMVIISDCTSLAVTGSKESMTKTLAAELKQTDFNYLVEILPGDWVLAWIVNDETSLLDLVERIRKADPQKPCNGIQDGLKFVGRVHSVRKRISLNRGSGTKTSAVTLSAIGFRELNTMFFYDNQLATNDTLSGNIGSWLAEVGLSVGELFPVSIREGQKNNSRKLITTLLDLLVGRGVGPIINRADKQVLENGDQVYGRLRAATGGGTTDTGEAPFAYLVPRVVGALLGKQSSDVSKTGGLLSYADILNTIAGVQEYETGAGSSQNTNNPYGLLPKLQAEEGQPKNRLFTGKELLGTFLPVTPEFTNKPLWSVFQQFLNPHINEMYTCMRLGPNGVQPTMVIRQIPFTTDIFQANGIDGQGPLQQGQNRDSVPVTRFLNIPRWKLHPAMVNDIDIGRSDDSRVNFVHVYGQGAVETPQINFTSQIVDNPPIRDDLDIQRNGLRTYMTTVACAIRDQVGNVPSVWMSLIADRLIGSQYTLNGTISSVGIQAPICEGDNLEWDGVVYHIESLAHHCSVDLNGGKTFSTTLTLTNGLNASGTSDTGSGTGGAPSDSESPIYPGFKPGSTATYDPGITIEDRYSRDAPALEDTDISLTDDQKKDKEVQDLAIKNKSKTGFVGK